MKKALIIVLLFAISLCSYGQVTITFKVNQADELIIASGDDISVCQNIAVQLAPSMLVDGGTGNYNYSWFPVDGLSSSTDPKPEVTASKDISYTITVRDEKGCTKSDSIGIVVIETNISATTDSICSSDSIFWQDQWLNEAGSYYSENPNGEGCSIFEMNLVVIEPPDNFLITGKTAVEQSEVALYSFPNNDDVVYHWIIENGNEIESSANTVNIQWGNSGVGNISVFAQNTTGCFSDTTKLDVTINTTGVLSNQLADINVYPNPFNNNLYVELGKQENECSLRVCDVTGKVISLRKYNNIRLIELDTEELSHGMYFIQVNTELESVVLRVVKD